MWAHADVRKICVLLLFSVKVNGEIVRREIGYVVTLGIGDHGVHLDACGGDAEYNIGSWGILLGEQERSAKHNADPVFRGSARACCGHLAVTGSVISITRSPATSRSTCLIPLGHRI